MGRRFDKERQNDPFRKLYMTARWERIRIQVCFRDMLCQICQTAEAVIADHIIPARVWVKGGGDFFDESNLQGLCKKCHDHKTATEDKITLRQDKRPREVKDDRRRVEKHLTSSYTD